MPGSNVVNLPTLGLLASALILVSLAVVFFWRRARRATVPADSVFERVQDQQHTLWRGVPFTVVFDYQPYLKETARHRVNVHTVQRDTQGAHSLVGYCHDSRDDRVFLAHSIRGELLVEKSAQAIEFAGWLSKLQAGEFD